MNRRTGVVALLAALVVPAVAMAGGWEDTFHDDAVSTYFDVAGGGAMVVGAGEASEELDAATAALAQALRDGGKTSVVMDAAALGDTSGLGDADIVTRAAAYPIERVVVVRVFPAGDSMSCVATFYDKSGQVQQAFNARKGEAVAPRSGGGGVSSGTSETVDSVLTDPTPGSGSAVLDAPRVRLRTEDGAVDLTWESVKVTQSSYVGLALEWDGAHSEFVTTERQPQFMVYIDRDPSDFLFVAEPATDEDDDTCFMGLDNQFTFATGQELPEPDDTYRFEATEVEPGKWRVDVTEQLDVRQQHAIFLMPGNGEGKYAIYVYGFYVDKAKKRK
jgi:hypothetical protein